MAFCAITMLINCQKNTKSQNITFRSRFNFEISYPFTYYFDSGSIENLVFPEDVMFTKTLTITNFNADSTPGNSIFEEGKFKIDINVSRLIPESLSIT